MVDRRDDQRGLGGVGHDALRAVHQQDGEQDPEAAGESTASSVGSRAATARFDQTSRGLRRTRSARVPSNGPTSEGAHIMKTVSAANAFDPVRDLTHTPAVSHIALVPKPETTNPVR